MKNKDAIEALIWFKSIASDACDGLGLALEIDNNFKKIEKTLTQAQESVDVDDCYSLIKEHYQVLGRKLSNEQHKLTTNYSSEDLSNAK